MRLCQYSVTQCLKSVTDLDFSSTLLPSSEELELVLAAPSLLLSIIAFFSASLALRSLLKQMNNSASKAINAINPPTTPPTIAPISTDLECGSPEETCEAEELVELVFEEEDERGAGTLLELPVTLARIEGVL